MEDKIFVLQNLFGIFILIAILLLAFVWGIRRWIKGLKQRKRQKQRQQILLQRGKEGEQNTEDLLRTVWGYKRILRNIYIPKGEGRGYSEIDLILLHKKGIFVIENKNYTGRIWGEETEPNWRLLPLDQRSRRAPRYFYNPIKQNQVHMMFLKRFLNKQMPELFQKQVSFLSVVTFNDRARLKKIKLHSGDVIVTESRNVRRKLHKKMRKTRRCLTKSQINQLFEILQQTPRSGKKMEKKHLIHLKKAGHFNP